ncbi:hypothetical protein [Bacillus gobiensis]|uniref:Uncharacterized protein n=1 Tax=Bacillus gobiensis TaxID=1441095 RepID=A0A0M3R9J9_9BACI|nr:hypothetical protein [Bacillus gobiensis]ALC81556.1 hypothetical protein AM592_08050 [Bacillus gobiensis]
MFGLFNNKKNQSVERDKRLKYFIEMTKRRQDSVNTFGLRDEINKLKTIKSKENKLKTVLNEVEQKSDIVMKHFSYMHIASEYKRLIKEDPKYYHHQIEVLKKDCALFPRFIHQEREDNKNLGNQHGDPNYSSFRELAIAYERTGEIEEAIKISRKAIELGVKDNTSFENRIKKLEKKL